MAPLATTSEDTTAARLRIAENLAISASRDRQPVDTPTGATQAYCVRLSSAHLKLIEEAQRDGEKVVDFLRNAAMYLALTRLESSHTP